MDILDHVVIERPCELCGDAYAVSARVSRDSESMLHDCCPVDNERECPQLRYAALIEPELLDELSAVWERIEVAASARGFRATLSSVASAPAPKARTLAPRIDAYREAKIEAMRVTRESTAIEHCGHYDTDSPPQPCVVTSDVLQHERDAAVALADEILGHCGPPCC